MFTVIADLPLSEYIRRRRLTQAAIDLCSTPAKVIDIALKYGYESPDAFAVAFRRMHNLSPTAARKRGAALKAYPRLTLSITMKGDVEMNYRIEQRPAFQATGKVMATSNIDNKQLGELPAFWIRCSQDGTLDALYRIGGGPVTGRELLGICFDCHPDGRFSYMIGVGTDGNQQVPDGMETVDIPASTWAIFDSVGPMPDAIQLVWKRIFEEFMPTSDYRHAGTPDFELYYPGDNDANYRSEVWIPVVRKS